MSANYITIDDLCSDDRLPGDLRDIAKEYDGSLRVPLRTTLDADILAKVELGTGGLEMGDWHTCETVHCLAGWAIALTGDDGRTLERELGPENAGALIYFASTGDVPDFYEENEDALWNLRSRVAAAKENK